MTEILPPQEDSLRTGAPSAAADGQPHQRYPPGVVLGKDGKPCRSCTSWKEWAALKRKEIGTNGNPAASSTQPTAAAGRTAPRVQTFGELGNNAIADVPNLGGGITGKVPDGCPPDVEQLGRSTWTFLHAVTASWPEKATLEQQKEMSTFLQIFSRIYPCWNCAADFQSWIAIPENRIAISGDDGNGNDGKRFLSTRDGFGRWMCRAHNAVNVKLGKPEFNCDLWEHRWRTGWSDGRCD